MKYEIGTFRKLASFALAAALALAPIPALAGTITGGYFPGLPVTQPPLSGNEQVPVDTNLPGGQAPQTELLWVSNIVTSGRNAFSTATNTSAFTATTAQTSGAANVTLSLTGTLSAGAAITLPTAALLVAARSHPYVGETYRLRIINNSSGAFAWTVTAGTGDTVTGTATVAQSTWREYMVSFTNVTSGSEAVTFQNIGAGTN